MSRHLSSMAFVGLAVSWGACQASTADPDTDPVRLTASYRLWMSNWDQSIIDVIPTPSGGAKIGYTHSYASKPIGITSLAISFGKFLTAASIYRNTSYDGNGNYPRESVSRNEMDLSVGYQFAPGLIASVTRKSGALSGLHTQSATDAMGFDGAGKFNGLLAGLSASAPLSGRWFMFGSLAAGRAKFRYDADTGAGATLSYRIVEAGAAYRLDLDAALLGVNAVTFQMGYRVQSLTSPKLSAIDGLPLEADPSKGRSTTDGVFAGISLNF